MRIGGFQSFSLSDYPGMTAAIVFTQGCNFRCPFCHNGALIPACGEGSASIPEMTVLRHLHERRGLLDGVVVTGGEPTLQPDLPRFLRRIREMGYAVKLDTNGSRPGVLRRLLAENLVDYIAMDIKAPMACYDRLTGVAAPVRAIRGSIRLIARSGISHEFRTTVVKPLLSESDILAIAEMVPSGSPHTLQDFNPEHAYDPALRTFVPTPDREDSLDSKTA
ncbi:MAG TPA: anaerobic ribonucleoside-triphosphate reductase activating protein [Patescibacteria group bacterium]|nr:anaerobic ribonucleoside-triphosphate reductase activating protein [Patescibacteria group bacterium]